MAQGSTEKSEKRGERYINRVWSASADGYDEEAAAYLHKAEKRFAEAQEQLLAAAANR